MNRNLNRRIHPIAEADGLSPKKLVKVITKEGIGAIPPTYKDVGIFAQ